MLNKLNSEQLPQSKPAEPGRRCRVVEAGTTDSPAPHAFYDYLKMR